MSAPSGDPRGNADNLVVVGSAEALSTPNNGGGASGSATGLSTKQPSSGSFSLGLVLQGSSSPDPPQQQQRLEYELPDAMACSRKLAISLTNNANLKRRALLEAFEWRRILCNYTSTICVCVCVCVHNLISTGL